MNPLGAGKQSKLMAISVAPSFNYTNAKRTSVAGFTLVQTLDNAESTAEKTTFNGQPAYLLDQTTQATCTGDEAGWAGGVKSGTVGKEVKPTSGSSSILVEGKQLVREGDSCTMNNGNVTGKYFKTSNPNVQKVVDALKNQERPVLFAGRITGSKKDTINSSQLDGEGMTDEEIQKKVKEIRNRYKKMIKNAKSLNKNFAANNLQHFIEGSGKDRVLKSDFIKSFSAVQDAEDRIKGYIQDRQLQKKSGKYIQNEDIIISKDYWNADIKEYRFREELTYASGASKIKTDVEISLRKTHNDIYTGTGVANFRWYDNYDWNENQNFYIPFTGTVEDNDGIFLKKHGGAKDFLLESKWQLSFEGQYNPKTKQWESFRWKD